MISCRLVQIYTQGSFSHVVGIYVWLDRVGGRRGGYKGKKLREGSGRVEKQRGVYCSIHLHSQRVQGDGPSFPLPHTPCKVTLTPDSLPL